MKLTKISKCFAALGTALTLSLCACGTDPALTQFKNEMDAFCSSIYDINDSINRIDASDENASSLALDYLDQLDNKFQEFAAIDFPEAYAYLEPLADEAATYMQTAVENYHLVYAENGYDEEKADYARENSARAFKRIQIILQVLHGEDPSADEKDVSDNF